MLKNSTEYTLGVARELITRYANGETLAAICKDEHMPDRTTVIRWRSKYADFEAAYLRARDMSVDQQVEDTIDIADTDRDPQRARNRIAARQWRAAKLKPKEYGDKIELSVNERPSLKPAIEGAFERVSGPVRDQLTTRTAELIDLTGKFFGDPNDYQSPGLQPPDIFDDDDPFS